MVRTLLFHKPFDVLSQFTDVRSPSPRQTLSNFVNVPDIYPAGRLDRDSEGLMILTDDGTLQALISNPRHTLQKVYFAQVEGVPTDADLAHLRAGVILKDGLTRPSLVTLGQPPDIWDRIPPVRYRRSIPDTWIKLIVSEGRNRQVRRMTAHIGFPTLRLIRWQIGRWSLDGLAIGQWRDSLDETK